MARKNLARLLGAAVTLTALVAALTAFGGGGTALGSAAQANYAPQNTAPPTISGTPTVDSTLTATTGSWNSQAQPTYAYAWQRCNPAGNGCAAISGATAATYKVQSADVGATLRVAVTATDSSGSTSATSVQTAAVVAAAPAGPAGAIKLGNGKTSIPASSVTLPARLVIDGVRFQPSRLHGRASFLARFHISDTRGYVVRDALVYALGLPYAWVKRSAEVSTAQDGWGSVTMTPSAQLPTSRGHALVVFVRARVQGQPVLAGSSARRLVQVTTGG